MEIDRTPGAPDWAVSTVTVAGKSFGIAYGKETTRENDPVADGYRTGSLRHLATLTRVAVEVLEPGARVLDLGSHLGGFALTAAAFGCEVIAVEASPRNAALLRISAEYNQFRHLHVVHAAVSDERSTLEFSPNGPWGHVATPATEEASVSVPAIRIDDLLAERAWDSLQFVKIDLEGFEVRALRGMPRLLDRPDAPLIFFESNRHALAWFGESPESLRTELHRRGYVVYHVRPGVLIRTRAADGQRKTVVDYVAGKRLPPRLAAWQRTSARSLVWRLKRFRDRFRTPSQ